MSAVSESSVLELKRAFDGEAVPSANRRKTLSPLTLRLTVDERAKLEELAAGMTLSAYVRACVFAEETTRLAFAHRRKDVHALNQAIRAALRTDDPNNPDVLLQTATGKRAFGDGDRIVFTRNDRDIGVKNGILGTVEKADGSELVVKMDGDQPQTIQLDPRSFQSFDHGYAVTIHKSQGATVDQAYVLASRSMDRHLAYVAMTRHREAMRMFIRRDDRPSWDAEPRELSRAQRDHQPTRSGPSID